MLKKISLYIGLILIAINFGNGNLFKLYSFIRQKIILNTIIQEKINICDPLQEKIENYIYTFRNINYRDIFYK